MTAAPSPAFLHLSERSFFSADASCPAVFNGLAVEHLLHCLSSRKLEDWISSKSLVILTPQLKVSAPPNATAWTMRLFLFLYINISGPQSLERVTGSPSKSDSELSRRGRGGFFFLVGSFVFLNNRRFAWQWKAIRQTGILHAIFPNHSRSGSVW